MTTESTSPETNAKDLGLAQLLATGLEGETLVSLTTRKKGVTRGGLVYDDDLVHVLLWTGFNYGDLVDMSIKYFAKLDQDKQTVHALLDHCHACGREDVTLEDVILAGQELQDSLWKSHNSSKKEHEPSLRDERYKPLEVNGSHVKGCKVFVGEASEDYRDPVPGSIYITGLKLAEQVLDPAPNGHWEAKQAPIAFAKEELRKRLPVGRFVSYVFQGRESGIILTGPEAVLRAQQKELHVDPGAILALFSLRNIKK